MGCVYYFVDIETVHKREKTVILTDIAGQKIIKGLKQQHVAWSCIMDMWHVHAAWPCSIDMRMDMWHGHVAWTCGMHKFRFMTKGKNSIA